MRYREFELTEDELFELNMSPTNLSKMVKNIDARVGMEFELIVPGVEEEEEEEYDSEPDYDADEGFPVGRGWQREVISFFRGGDMGNSTSTIQRAIDSLNEDFWSWMDEAEQDFIASPAGQERIREIAIDNVDPSDYDEDSERELQQAIQDYLDQNEDYIRDEISQEFRDDADTLFERWLDEQEIRSMADFANEYNLDWPYWTHQEYYGGGGSISIDAVADEFSQAIGRPVNAASSYHGGRREAGHYVVEPDGSLRGEEGETGLEFVSPVLTVPEMLEDIDKVAKWASQSGAYTNNSTGLHMNVSVPDQENLDYVKLAMFLGDEYILKQFGREGNHYCKSALQKIRIQAGSNPDKVTEMMRQFQSGLNQLASKMIHTGSTEKFTSINNRGDWIEFRSPGGDWLGDDLGPVKNTLLRAVVALDVATKPDAFKQEYYKKLYKTLNPKGDDDSIQYFARYAAGELPTSALKSFIRQIQTKRQVSKEKPDSGKLYWWRVSRPGYAGSIEVVAASAEEAIKKGTSAPDGYSSWQGERDVRAEPIRPYEQGPEQSPGASHPEGRGRPHDPNGRYAIVSREDPAAYQTGRGTEPEYLFRFNMSNPAEQHNGRYILAAWAARNSVDPANYMVVDAERWDTPAVAGSTQDLQRQRLAAQMPALDTADGNWEIYSISSQNTVYRFTANTEEQAVQAFRIWQDAIRSPNVPREGFNLRTTQGSGGAEQTAPTERTYRVTYTGRDGTNSTTVSAPNANAAMDRVRRQFYGSELTNIEAELAAETPARGTESLPPGNTRWLVMDQNDREVYSFVHRSNQGEANQYAANWLRQNGMLGQGEFMVVPAR